MVKLILKSYLIRSIYFSLLMILSISISVSAEAEVLACDPLTTPYGTVCKCTRVYCDSIAAIPTLSKRVGAMYQTVAPSHLASGSFLSLQAPVLVDDYPQAALQIIDIDPTRSYQKIIGFGGAFTDATVLNITRMSAVVQNEILRAYFAKEGLGYNLVRIPMASSDFSSNVYSYDDAPAGDPEFTDFKLKHFALNAIDTHYKIPLLLKAQALAPSRLYVYASPWSAPSWMKMNEVQPMVGGYLKPEPQYYQAWALYFAKFIAAYTTAGVPIFAVTVQNEPHDNLGWFQSMLYTPAQQATFIAHYLGPLLKKTAPQTKIFIHDDAIGFLPNDVMLILSRPQVAQYVAGIGLHWYFAPGDKTERLEATHRAYPQQILMNTEASIGFIPPDNGPKLGDWSRGEAYATDIIDDFNHWVAAWTDWNMVLNPEGGPNWAKSFTDAPIIIDPALDAFYKQPMYYYLGQFSHFITRGATRIESQSNGLFPLQVLAVKTQAQQLVVVVMNKDSFAKNFAMRIHQLGYVNHRIPAHAIQTYVFKDPTAR